MARTETETEIVLVHGKFHGAWCWDPIRAALEAQYAVATPELPFTSLADDVAVVRTAVESASRRARRVVLVGHSYAGVVISLAGHAASHLVFLAALAPLEGRTNADESEAAATPTRSGTITESNGLHSLNGPGVRDAFYHLCTDEQFAEATVRLRACSAAVEDEAVEHPAWRSVASTYVVCTEDHAVAPAYQRARAALMSRSYELRADHSPFFSAPDDLTRTLLEIAGDRAAERSAEA
jgi:pimeloyl-ACP methyl ester carboxylesterase